MLDIKVGDGGIGRWVGFIREAYYSIPALRVATREEEELALVVSGGGGGGREEDNKSIIVYPHLLPSKSTLVIRYDISLFSLEPLQATYLNHIKITFFLNDSQSLIEDISPLLCRSITYLGLYTS